MVFSMHIIDFSDTTAAHAQQYEDNLALMCDSPRFSAWTTTYLDYNPPFFIPALTHDPKNGADPYPSAVLVPGVDLTNYAKIAAVAENSGY